MKNIGKLEKEVRKGLGNFSKKLVSQMGKSDPEMVNKVVFSFKEFEQNIINVFFFQYDESK